MTSNNIQDLKYLYYGGGTDAEYAYLAASATAGRTAADLLNAAPRWTVGAYYTPIGTVSASALALNAAYAAPILVPPGSGIDRLVCETTTAVGSATARLYVCADDGFGMPGAVLYQSGSIDISTIAVFTDTTIALTNLRGVQYWVGLVNQGAAATMRTVLPPGGVGATAYTATATAVKFRASVTGVVPTPLAATSSNATGPRVAVRAA